MREANKSTFVNLRESKKNHVRVLCPSYELYVYVHVQSLEL